MLDTPNGYHIKMEGTKEESLRKIAKVAKSFPISSYSANHTSILKMQRPDFIPSLLKAIQTAKRIVAML